MMVLEMMTYFLIVTDDLLVNAHYLYSSQDVTQMTSEVVELNLMMMTVMLKAIASMVKEV